VLFVCICLLGVYHHQVSYSITFWNRRMPMINYVRILLSFVYVWRLNNLPFSQSAEGQTDWRRSSEDHRSQTPCAPAKHSPAVVEQSPCLISVSPKTNGRNASRNLTKTGFVDAVMAPCKRHWHRWPMLVDGDGVNSNQNCLAMRSLMSSLAPPEVVRTYLLDVPLSLLLSSSMKVQLIDVT